MAGIPAHSTPLVDLAKGITDSAFVMNRERRILEANRPFLKTHEVDPKRAKQLAGSFCRDHVSLEICEKQCILLQCLEAGASVRFDEVKGKTRTGEEKQFIVTAVPIRDEKGEIVSVLEMHRDVTDEARIHEKYKVLLDKEKRAKEELERLVHERTRELRQAQSHLVHSEKMSSLGQLVAGIAHELNNPINFICGNTDPLEEYAGDIAKAVAALEETLRPNAELHQAFTKVKEDHELDYKLSDLIKVIQSIRRGGDRAADIIQGLRTFSRLDEAQIKETDLHQDIDTSLTLLQHEHKNRIKIHREYGNLPPVACFASQLNQVFMNLLHNAMQAIQGEGDIWIRTRVDGPNVVVEIKDSGPGIPPDVLPKIFDPFFTTKEVGKGTGLGLSITYGIVERHGGKIEVDTALGKGTTFRVIVPLKLQLKEGTS